MLESTVRSIFFQSARRWMNSYTLPAGRWRERELSVKIGRGGISLTQDTLFWPERSPVTRGVAHDLGEVFRILDNVDVADHLEV